MGRPKKYTDEAIEQIQQNMEQYIQITDIPIIAEFAYKNNIPRHVLYDYDEFSTLLKKLTDKKEAQLERLGLTGKVDKTMAIFSLKQLGWRDKNETEHTGTVGVSIIDDIKKPCKKE